MKNSLLQNRECLSALFLCLSLAFSLSATEPLVVPLWPKGKLIQSDAPEKVVNRSKDPSQPNRLVSAVSTPTLTVYLPEKSNKPTAAVVICPGGGYGGIAIDKEGHSVARWLNSNGIAGLILKYRLPRPELTDDNKPWPFADAERALQLARSHATEWNLNSQQVGIMGFSAGGHLASTIGTHFGSGKPTATDPVEKLSSRPDFMILVYPVITFKDPTAHRGSRKNLLGEQPDEKLVTEYSNELHVTPQTPPTFLIHAQDDPVSVTNSLLFHAALERAQVPSKLLLYPKGGHGFGLGTNGEVANWPKECIKWLHEIKIK